MKQVIIFILQYNAAPNGIAQKKSKPYSASVSFLYLGIWSSDFLFFGLKLQFTLAPDNGE